MSDPTLTPHAHEQLVHIHQLSSRYNRQAGVPHQRRLLELMRSHIDEIEALAARQDPHAMIETGDLLILCFELLLEQRYSPDEVMNTCFGRYHSKLTGLLAANGPRQGEAVS